MEILATEPDFEVEILDPEETEALVFAQETEAIVFDDDPPLRTALILILEEE